MGIPLVVSTNQDPKAICDLYVLWYLRVQRVQQWTLVSLRSGHCLTQVCQPLWHMFIFDQVQDPTVFSAEKCGFSSSHMEKNKNNNHSLTARALPAAPFPRPVLRPEWMSNVHMKGVQGVPSQWGGDSSIQILHMCWYRGGSVSYKKLMKRPLDEAPCSENRSTLPSLFGRLVSAVARASTPS